MPHPNDFTLEQFDALVRDAKRYRWVRNVKSVQSALGETRPEGVDILADIEVALEEDAQS